MPLRPLPASLSTACVALALITAAARGETVQLPYQVPGGSDVQWTVYVQGNLQQQGNQPIFQQAGMITVNGQQPQMNTQNATLDATGTLSMSFTPRGALRQSRQFKFNEDTQVVRVIDILENTQAGDMTANIMLMTIVNFGINDATTITEPKAKDAELGWIANTGANRAAMSLFAGKGAKTVPSVKYRQGNNAVNAQYQIKVPGKSRVAIVHWHGTFETTDAASQWAQQFNERKDLADVPAELRKQIIDLGGGGSDFVAGREMLRGAANDVIELVGGDQIRGDLKPAGYTLLTSYGTVKLPTDKIAGILTVGGFPPRQLVITSDGEIFGGQLQEPSLPMLLTSGQTTAVPFAQIARVGCRVNGEPVPWKLDQPMAFLAGGERCRIEPPADAVAVATRYGTLQLTAQQIATVLMPPDAETQTFYLSDGSRISGVIDRQQWAFKLVSVPAGEPVSFPVAALMRVQLATLPDNTGAGQPTAALLGNDIVSARVSGTLKLVTTFDTLSLDAGQARSITHPDAGQSDVLVTMFDGSSFRGRLDTPTLSLQLTSGPSLEIPVAALRDYQNPRPLPAQSLIDQVAATVKLLNADDWKQREQAEATLVGMGAVVMPVLQDSQNDQPPEARERLTAIIAKLKKDQPAVPSRLTPPPSPVN